MKLEFSRHIFGKYSDTKFHENPSSCFTGRDWRSQQPNIACLRTRLKKGARGTDLQAKAKRKATSDAWQLVRPAGLQNITSTAAAASCSSKETANIRLTIMNQCELLASCKSWQTAHAATEKQRRKATTSYGSYLQSICHTLGAQKQIPNVLFATSWPYPFRAFWLN